jgi:hypothetical protein
MDKFLQWFADSPLASALRVAIAYIVGTMVAEFAKVGTFDFTNWKSWLIGALVVAIPPILRWLNPADTAFGKGSQG